MYLLMNLQEASKEDIRIFKKVIPNRNILSNGNITFYIKDNYIFEVDNIRDNYSGVNFYDITVVNKETFKHIESKSVNTFNEVIDYINNYIEDETVC